MKEKIQNWWDGSMIHGVGLLFLSLCMVSFGGAYLGAERAINGRELIVQAFKEIPEKEEME